jgi:hypothetical protein
LNRGNLTSKIKEASQEEGHQGSRAGHLFDHGVYRRWLAAHQSGESITKFE